MLCAFLVCLLLYNIVADKHILISVFISARGTKCSGDASFFWCNHLSSVLSLLMLLLAKARGLLWAVSKTTDASALVSALKKLELTEMCPRESSRSCWFDNPYTWLTQLQLQTQPTPCRPADVQLLTFLVCKWQPRSWPSSAFAKFVLFWQKPECHCSSDGEK